MAHSKRNTSLAFFTTHERSQLKTHWGSQSTRLTRDSFLPFASCNLCLQPSRSPVVACASHGDVFCRECIVGNLLAQRAEIKRLEKEAGRRRKEAESEEKGRADEERERSVREFESTMMGLERKSGGNGSMTATGTADGRREGEGRGVKRKFELDEEEVRKNTKEERAKARKAIDDEKSAKPTLPAFWVPSLTPSSNLSTTTTNAPKPTPICPASSPSSPHPLSLKSLITLTFSTSTSTSTSANPPTNANTATVSNAICPACTKPLSNASKAVFTVPCGHVLCKPCAGKFMPMPSSTLSRVETANPHAAGEGEEAGGPRCYVCETSLADEDSALEKGDAKKGKGKEKGAPKRGLVEIRSEGTGFAGGGKNMAKREGVAFQC